MRHHAATFYLAGRFVGSVQLPYTPLRACDHPISHHYIDPDDGEIWASVEIAHTRWSSWIIPKLGNKNPANALWPRGLRLDWLLGPELYLLPERLATLPRPVLELEYAHHLYNHDRGLV